MEAWRKTESNAGHRKMKYLPSSDHSELFKRLVHLHLSLHPHHHHQQQQQRRLCEACRLVTFAESRLEVRLIAILSLLTLTRITTLTLIYGDFRKIPSSDGHGPHTCNKSGAKVRRFNKPTDGHDRSHYLPR